MKYLLIKTKQLRYHKINVNREFTPKRSNILRDSYYLLAIALLKRYLQLFQKYLDQHIWTFKPGMMFF